MFRYCLGLVFCSISSATLALPTITVQQTKQGMELIAHNAPLARVLEAVALKTHTALHTHALPKQDINRHCVTPSLHALIDCIFAQAMNTVSAHRQIWILTSSLTALNAVNISHEPVPKAAWQELLNAPQVQTRIDVLADLAKRGHGDAKQAHAALARGLSDSNAQVRAQAVASLASREGRAATALLQTALGDKAVAVRLMVVDSAGDNVRLLEKARLDSEGTVRAYALQRLRTLLATQSAH